MPCWAAHACTLSYVWSRGATEAMAPLAPVLHFFVHGNMYPTRPLVPLAPDIGPRLNILQLVPPSQSWIRYCNLLPRVMSCIITLCPILLVTLCPVLLVTLCPLLLDTWWHVQGQWIKIYIASKQHAIGYKPDRINVTDSFVSFQAGIQS